MAASIIFALLLMLMWSNANAVSISVVDHYFVIHLQQQSAINGAILPNTNGGGLIAGGTIDQIDGGNIDVPINSGVTIGIYPSN